MASTEKLPSGKYRGIYRDAAGRKQRVKGTFGRMSDARAAAQEAEVKARREAARTAGTLSARTTWDQWWDLLSQRRVLDSETPVTEHYIVERYLRPQWGDAPLNRITRVEVQDWVDGLKVGKSAAYTQRIYSVFSVSINRAVKAGVLAASPCVEIDLPKRAKRPKPHATTQDVAAVRATLRGDYADAVEFLLETGLRPGELAGLHVNRIDLESGWLEVVEVFVGGRTKATPAYVRDYPKDEDSRRVPLTDRAVEIARRQLEGRVVGSSCGLPHSREGACSSDLLFRTKLGRAVSPHNLQRRLKSAFEDAALDSKSPYASRRGFATRLAEGGANAFEIAAWMGHNDIRMSQEYVQQTAAARGRLRAALGEQTPLTVLGGRGTGRGTDRDGQPLESTGIDDAGRAS